MNICTKLLFSQFPTITVSGPDNGTICWGRGRLEVQRFNNAPKNPQLLALSATPAKQMKSHPRQRQGWLQDSSICNLAETQICDYNTLTKHLVVIVRQYSTSIYFADKMIIIEKCIIQSYLTHLSTQHKETYQIQHLIHIIKH